jgi:hypothetical protein
LQNPVRGSARLAAAMPGYRPGDELRLRPFIVNAAKFSTLEHKADTLLDESA